MAIDILALAEQFRGKKLAELVLHHVNAADATQSLQAVMGLIAELPPEYKEPVTHLIDFMTLMPQSEQAQFFSADCGEQLLNLIALERGFFNKNFSLHLTDESAFTVFNILIQNYAYSCHKNPGTKAAMQKAAGHSFIRRLFGG